jgi:DNA-nicking Smr family endonuclease
VKRPTDEEAALFREWVREVKRLPAGKRSPEREKSRVAPARPRASLRSKPDATHPAGERSTPPLEAGDALRFARSGVSRRELRELRRGRLRAQAVLDLHGLTAARAELALRDFLGQARERGLTSIRIVHGKGLHSGADGPVLKNLVDAALRGTATVRAFASALPTHGGAGAVNVLLEP